MSSDRPIPARRSSAVIAVAFFVVGVWALPAAAGKRDTEIVVESNPSGALVSVHTTADGDGGGGRLVAGETPLQKTFRFPKKGNLWLRFEKRGYEPEVVEIGVTATRVSVDLAPMKPAVTDLEPVAVLAVVAPDLTVIRRGFAKEREDEPAGTETASVIVAAIGDHLAGRVEIVVIGDSGEAEMLRPLWRDVHSHMELVDPIGLPYMPVAPRLESRASRAASAELAERTGADAVLFVAGKTNVETGGMKAGKIGIMAVGTASSFASGYSNAMANGNDFFTYTIYLPSFSEGTGLEALLVDIRDGVIRWANKGMWKPLPLDRPEVAEAVVADLLSGVETHLLTNDTSVPLQEEP